MGWSPVCLSTKLETNSQLGQACFTNNFPTTQNHPIAVGTAYSETTFPHCRKNGIGMSGTEESFQRGISFLEFSNGLFCLCDLVWVSTSTNWRPDG
jgi:hypothetical protein